jgi:hypothetical protein
MDVRFDIADIDVAPTQTLESVDDGRRHRRSRAGVSVRSPTDVPRGR